MSELAYLEQEENTDLYSLEQIRGSLLLEETERPDGTTGEIRFTRRGGLTEQPDGTTGEIRLTRRGGLADTISGGRIVPTTRGEID